MRKRITKIICTAVAAISAATLVFAPACSSRWNGVSGKDTSALVEGANGGFLTQTEDYVYFINGKAANTDSNNFGSVVKGSVQRIKKSELASGNYAASETVVPSVIYSGNNNAGLYVYGEYLYYTSPTTERDSDGNVLNSNLDFKRTKLDGTGTSGHIWQSSDNAVDYRFVPVGDTVYIIYALSETLYTKQATNIHSVNCSTGKNTVLAYDVSSYKFDTVDLENPQIFYTMDVNQFIDGSGSDAGYNQLYTVRADATESPREYNFDDVDDYNAGKEPYYINLGDYVFDGIGKVDYEQGAGQFNYAYYKDKLFDKNDPSKGYSLDNGDYTYELSWYKDGVLYYHRNEAGSDKSFYRLNASELVGSDGRVISSWDAVTANDAQEAFIGKEITTDYTYITLNGAEYALSTGSGGIIKTEVKSDGTLGKEVTMSSDSGATVIDVKKHAGHDYLYYFVAGTNGSVVKRLVIDGDEDKYLSFPDDGITYPEEGSEQLTYESIAVLDIEVCSDWYKPEFVGTKMFYASADDGYSSYNYIKVFDFGNGDNFMTNKQLEELNEKFDAVAEKIKKYDDAKKEDDSPRYEGLSSALTYLFNTGDVAYMDELVKAYTDLKGEKEVPYNEESIKIFKDYAACEGDWADYKNDFKTVNGEKVCANSVDYYYTVVGKVTGKDAEAIRDYFRSADMKEYPVDGRTWWQKLSTGGKVGFVIGMVACGLLVVGGVTVLVIWLVRRKKREGGEGGGLEVDITDDRNVDVYGGEEKQE